MDTYEIDIPVLVSKALSPKHLYARGFSVLTYEMPITVGTYLRSYTFKCHGALTYEAIITYT